jgi:hypothetical protein
MLAAVIALAAAVVAAPAALAQYGGTATTGGHGQEHAADGGACPPRPEPGAKILNGDMDGRVEVPPGDPDGTGQVTVWLKGDRVWFKLTWEGIDPPNLSHIHKAPLGKAGEPVIKLSDGAPRRQGCVLAPAATVSAIAADPAAYYVNVHNQRHPKGAIRAQLAAGERPVLPFTGKGSAQLLLAGSLVTMAGMALVVASRRYGVRIGRHLATQGAPSRAGRPRREPGQGDIGDGYGAARTARRWDDNPW